MSLKMDSADSSFESYLFNIMICRDFFDMMCNNAEEWEYVLCKKLIRRVGKDFGR